MVWVNGIRKLTERGEEMVKAVRFCVHYWTRPGQNIVLVGSDDALGAWDLSRGLRLGHNGGGDWTLEVRLSEQVEVEGWEYKYVVVDDHSNSSIWEAGSNHTIASSTFSPSTDVVEMRDTFQVCTEKD